VIWLKMQGGNPCFTLNQRDSEGLVEKPWFVQEARKVEKTLLALCLTIVPAYGSACATPYQPQSALGEYYEVVWKIPNCENR